MSSQALGKFAPEGLPEGWRQMRIGEAIEEANSPIEMHADEEYLLASIRRRFGGMFHRERLYGREILTKNLQRVVPGRFVIARMQIVHGACALVDEQFKNHAISKSYSSFKSTEQCDTRFFSKLAEQPFMTEYFRDASHGVVIEKMTFQQERWLDFPIWLPPVEEQQRIADILDTIDEAIQATERIIVKLLDIEYGLRRDLLDGKFEGAHSEGWKHCRIGDFATVRRGASPRPIGNPAWFSSDGPGWIRISDVTEADDLLLHTRDHLSPAGVARSRNVCPGDVIMSIAATIGVAIVVGIEACYHDGFVRIDHDDSVIPEFLVMLLEHHEQGFIRSGQTGTQANINSSIVASTEVALPSLDIQSEIVAATSTVRGAIRAEKDSCRVLQATRAGLAGDLLSGRVRTVAA